MRKKYFFGTAFLLLCVAVWGVVQVMKPHRNVASEQTEATMSAKALYNEFESNEKEAGKKWIGKVIEVSGIIISASETDKYVSINLGGTADGGINCSLLKKDLNAGDKFNPGDKITIKGKCTGFLMDVNLVDCIIEK
jgi:hypothetical protein